MRLRRSLCRQPLSPLLVPRLQLQSAFSPSPLPPQQLPSVLCRQRWFLRVSSSSRVAEHSVEFLLLIWNHSFDGLAVLIVFVFMMQGKDEALLGLYPSGVWRHAHPVGLRHLPKCFFGYSFALWKGPSLEKLFVDSLTFLVPLFLWQRVKGYPGERWSELLWIRVGECPGERP